jgi:hypothetical protein
VFLKEKISTFTSTQYNISAISRLPENAALGDRIAGKFTCRNCFEQVKGNKTNTILDESREASRWLKQKL